MGFVRGTIFLLIFAAISAFAEGTACQNSIGSCDYYQCRESFQNCGAKGYLLGFGERYCNLFEDSVQFQMSAQGEQWLGEVARCLQQKLDDLSLSASCQETHAFAISTHAECYLQTGFCQLSLADQLQVVRTVYKEAIDPRVDLELFKIVEGCGEQDSLTAIR